MFEPSGKSVSSRLGNLLEIARDAGVEIDAPCGGRETCGKCRVIIKKDCQNISSMKQAEKRFLSDAEIEGGYRLSCCVFVEKANDVVLEVPPESQVGIQRLLVGGQEPFATLAPVVQKFFLRVPKPKITDLRADTERLLQTLHERLNNAPEVIAHEALRALPGSLRGAGWEITAAVRENEVIAVESGGTEKTLYGFAVDIGTTKLAGYLVDLNTGRNVGTSSEVNPQVKHGGDVLTRISYVMEDPQKLRDLHQELVEAINHMISDVARKMAISEHMIYDVVAVGNTAMHHFLFNINPKSVGLSPYPAVVGRALDVRARDLGIKVNADAYVHSPPNVAGFVGADAVADIIATEVYKAEELTLMIDIGTNVEIVLGDKNHLQACSTPAGPALEGAEISFGMRAIAGAIESLWIDPKDMSVGFRTIANESPKGICGSGIVDAIAEMRKAGIITNSGEIEKELQTPRIRVRNGIAEFLVVNSEESAIAKDIVVTQQDIRQIQLAKAAVYTGVLMSMKHLNVGPLDVKKVYVAGAFGTYLNSQSARNIGMYHDYPLNKIRYVGNAAGAGARALLKSRALRETASEVAKDIEYFHLGNEPEFQREFLNALYIPHKDLERFPSVKRLLGAG